MAGANPEIDPDVELLADIPISGPDEDLMDHGRVALRLVELAVAGPVTAPRMVALTGPAGGGKSSVLRLAEAICAARPDDAIAVVDAGAAPNAAHVMSALIAELTRVFKKLGVLDRSDKVRGTLAAYGGVVSSLVRLAGVSVDVAGALERSPASMRAELAHNLEHANRRLVIAIDHLDRMPPAEVGPVLLGLRMYTMIPYVAIVIAADRYELATRRPAEGVGWLAFERMVQVELALPPCDRILLARVMFGGLERIATRMQRNLDPVFRLFDPEGGLGLELFETPRDAKRAINALGAALPMVPAHLDLADAALETVLRVLVPEIDGLRLETRTRTRDRNALYAELVHKLGGHRRLEAARNALRALVIG
jgi:hypothetical protein